jgi:hypothetical protein
MLHGTTRRTPRARIGAIVADYNEDNNFDATKDKAKDNIERGLRGVTGRKTQNGDC